MFRVDGWLMWLKIDWNKNPGADRTLLKKIIEENTPMRLAGNTSSVAAKLL